jgi:hypothetical protein
MSDDDHIFLDEGGILISKTRFASGSQTFALASVSSVRGAEIAPNRSMPIFLILLGAIMGLIGIGATLESKWGVFPCAIGVASITVGVVTLCREKPIFAVMLTAAGGEVAAYTSRDKEFIARVINALTEAIIARG